MKHLAISDVIWCDDAAADVETTDDPRDAGCAECLRKAAAYGAASAMRYAAVEAGVHRDPELVHERDEAMRRLNAMQDALEVQRVFFCHDCMKLMNIEDRAVCAGSVSWCKRCAPNVTPRAER